MKRGLGISIILSAVLAVPVQSAVLLAPGDFVIAVDADGIVSNSSYPGGEAPPNILDNNPGTKYLNFAGAGSGFIVTPSGASTVRSFTMTTANDSPDRDPTSWELYGTNDAITSADNSTGTAENWALIDSGSVALPAARYTLGPLVTVNNSASYASYRMLYPSLNGSSMMQVADVAIYEASDGSGTSILGASNPILAIHHGWDSRYFSYENPANLIDGTLDKHLNFGEVNSGFIVTPSIGRTIVTGFEITTANDAEERDPASWVLYGTNEAVASGDNSDGTAELWTLIDSGTLALPSARNTLAAPVLFDNETAYASYKMLFPLVKVPDLANSMQIAEIQFLGTPVPEPATICLLGLGALGLLCRRLRPSRKYRRVRRV